MAHYSPVPDHYRHNENLLPEDLAMGMSPLQQLINTPPIPQDPSFWQKNPNGLLGHLSKVIGEDPSVVPKRMAVAMPAGLMDVAGGLNDLAIYGSNRVTNALGLPPIPAKTGFSGDPLREFVGLEPGGADEALELADPFMFPAKIGQAAKFAIFPLIGLAKGYKGTSFDALLRNKVIDPKNADFEGVTQELRGQALAWRNNQRVAEEAGDEYAAFSSAQYAERIEKNLAAIEEAGEVPFTFYAAEDKDKAIYFAEQFAEPATDLSPAEVGLRNRWLDSSDSGYVIPQVMAVEIDSKKVATVEDLQRVTGNPHRQTVSHLQPWEVLALKKEGFDAATGPIDRVGGDELVSFDPNNITIVRATGQPLDVKRGDDLFSADYLNKLHKITTDEDPIVFGTRYDVVEMTPREFLRVAATLGKPEKGKMARIEHLLNTGQRMDDGPMLQGEIVPIEPVGLGTARPLAFMVKGHEGRHRMTTLMRMGLGDVPVKIQFQSNYHSESSLLDRAGGTSGERWSPDIIVSEDVNPLILDEIARGNEEHINFFTTKFPGYLDHVPKFKDLPPDDPKVVSIPDGARRAWKRPYEGQNEPGALDIFGFGLKDLVTDINYTKARKDWTKLATDIQGIERQQNMIDAGFLSRRGFNWNDYNPQIPEDRVRANMEKDRWSKRIANVDETFEDWKRTKDQWEQLNDQRIGKVGEQVRAEQIISRVDAGKASKKFGLKIKPADWTQEHVQTAIKYMDEAYDADPRTWRRNAINNLRDDILTMRTVVRSSDDPDEIGQLTNLDMAESWLKRLLKE